VGAGQISSGRQGEPYFLKLPMLAVSLGKMAAFYGMESIVTMDQVGRLTAELNGQRRLFVRPACAAGVCQPLRVFALFFAKEGAQFFDVMPKIRREFHAGAANLFNERVARGFHFSPFISCKGVIKSGTAKFVGVCQMIAIPRKQDVTLMAGSKCEMQGVERRRTGHDEFSGVNFGRLNR
jgi:hypothetical protein